MKTTINNFRMMELISDKNGEPMMMFLSNDVCMSFPLVKSFDIHTCNEFLRSLDLGIDISFKTYRQYGELIMNCGLLLEEREAVTA